MEWIFDPVPASGARLGGDPSAFVFDASLGTFTREVLQNSVDQGIGDDPVQVRFRLDLIPAAEVPRFRQALEWDQLEQHLQGVLESAGQAERKRFERAPDEGGEDLLVLWIEDRGTTGLTGQESGGGTFAALCRDRLFSKKPGPGSLGSFGLGKAVLWRFSRCSTVVFYSRLPGTGRHRLIAKAALPWHRVGKREFAGDGWLGKVEGQRSRKRAVSLWGDEAAQAARHLRVEPLPEGTTGTCIGVVGFEDPAEEVDVHDLDQIVAGLHRAADRNFWPAMAMGRLVVEVGSPQGTGAPPRSLAPWRTMFETYWAHRESPVLADPGDVVVHKLTVRLPRPRGRHTSEVEAEFDLVVRLSAAEAPEVNELLAFRGAGMVVRRLQLDRLSAAARPFHAMLVGGLAKRDPSEADQSVEQFLRDAEPPSHDDWEVTPRLKQAWIRGYATAIRQIWDRSKETLRRLVSPPIEERDEGPAGLRRLFPVSGEGRGRGESSFRFGNLDAQLDGDVWSFRGEVEPAEPLEGAWQVRVDARVPDEGGTNQLVATLDAPGASARVEDGVGAIHAEPGTSAVAFEGTTRVSRFPLTPDRSSLELVVVGSEVVE